MEGQVGSADGAWFYVVRLGPVNGVDEEMTVGGFSSEADARKAMGAVDLATLQEYRRTTK